MFDALSKHHLMEDLSSIETNESLINEVSECTKLNGIRNSMAYESSISGSCLLSSGCTSFLRKSWLNAGLGIGLVCLFCHKTLVSLHAERIRAYGAGAAAVVWGLLVVSEVAFCDTIRRCGLMAAGEEDVEKYGTCDWRFLDNECKVVPEGRMGISLVAMTEFEPPTTCTRVQGQSARK